MPELTVGLLQPFIGGMVDILDDVHSKCLCGKLLSVEEEISQLGGKHLKLTFKWLIRNLSYIPLKGMWEIVTERTFDIEVALYIPQEQSDERLALLEVPRTLIILYPKGDKGITLSLIDPMELEELHIPI